MDSHIQSNLSVLVHCNGGRERTETLLTTYLMKKGKLTVEDALFKVKTIHSKSPHRPKQIEAIYPYENYLFKTR